jgi:hypothetical protein
MASSETSFVASSPDDPWSLAASSVTMASTPASSAGAMPKDVPQLATTTPHSKAGAWTFIAYRDWPVPARRLSG